MKITNHTVVRLLPTCASIPYSHTRRSKHTEYMYIASYLHVYVDPYFIRNVFPLFFYRHARYLMMGRSLCLVWSPPDICNKSKHLLPSGGRATGNGQCSHKESRAGVCSEIEMSLLYSSSPFMHTHTQTWSSNTVISLSFVCWSKKRYHSSGTC